MVNFSDSTTMTRPRKDIVNIMILQRIDNLVEAVEFFELKDDKARDNGLSELKSILLSLILLIKKPLERELKKQKKGTVKQLRQEIYKIDYEDKESLLDLVDYILDFVYDKDVTKWDTKEPTDRTDIIAMNKKILGGEN